MIAVTIAVIALLVTLFVQGYVGGGDADELAAFVEEQGSTPAELIVEGAGSRRIVVIGDVPGMAAPKQLTQQVLSGLATRGGVDALVVDVDTSFQPAFDRYTATTPEDASILTRAEGLLPGGEEGRHWLELYRSVYAVNAELGADRRIRILAAAPGPWPPREALPPKSAAEAYARRGSAMAERVSTQMLERTSRSRVVALIDPLQAIRTGYGELRVGGGGAIRADWFAAAMAQRYPVDVYSAILDVSVERSGYPSVVQFDGTRVHERLLKAVPAEAVGVPASGPIGDYGDPLQLRTGPGVTATILPDDHTLADLVDGYVFLPQ
ncbi:MAG TPA: hypothetical protein VF039_04455 [Longimicrobiales bacterium]